MNISELEKRIPDCVLSDAQLTALLADAESMCKAYLGRNRIPDGMDTAVYRMALALYNRMGMEGETSHSEGGVSVTADPMPEEVKAMLRPLRLAGIGG